MLYGDIKSKAYSEYTYNDRQVVNAWGKEGKYIESWYTRSGPIHDLRFVNRDGEKILQAEYFVNVTFSEPVFRFEFGWGGNRMEEEKYVWLDVPTEE